MATTLAFFFYLKVYNPRPHNESRFRLHPDDTLRVPLFHSTCNGLAEIKKTMEGK